MSPLDAALSLAERRLCVFPCRADKKPATDHGFKDASADPTVVRALWANHPGPLVGVRTGAASGFDVLDIDGPRHPEAWVWWNDNRHRIPATRIHRTGSGGLHILFRHAPNLRNTESRIAIGIDTRGDGGYCIWWPSAGCPILSDKPLAQWPEWLLPLAFPPPPPSPSPAGYSPSTQLADARLRGIRDRLLSARQGERNRLLFWAACRLAEVARDGSISHGLAVELLHDAAVQIGLDAHEIRKTIQSGFRTAGGQS